MSATAMNVDKVTIRRRYDSNGGRTVSPEPANSKTYMDSVMSFVKGLSQAYSHTAPADDKEPIAWARFFTYADAYGYESLEQDNLSLFLVLGYANGVQMWYLSTYGDAQEMFSLRDGPVKTVCLLPPPPPALKTDDLQAKRPLLAICLATDSKQIFACVSIVSLRTGEQVKKLQFSSDIVSLQAGPAPLFAVALKDSIHAFDMATLNCLFVINGCCCVGGNLLNPVALGSRWLVYSPNMHVTSLQSLGGFMGDGAPSYVTSMLNAAKTISKGISTVGDTVNWLAAKSRLTSGGDMMSSSTSSMTKNEHSWSGKRSSSAGLAEKEEDGTVAGIVTILDIRKILNNIKQNASGQAMALEINAEPDKDLVVAHFVAHVGQPLSCMRLSSSGTILATADVLGHSFHVFSIFSHPAGSTNAAVHHLYTLWRGKTPAQVQELRFSWDSRWLIASTLRGTCHIFPISPYGGAPNVRTHTSVRVVNRTSTFQKSAGLNDMDYFEPHPSPSRRPRSDSPTFSQGVLSWQTQHQVVSPRPLTINPRHPPFPQPISLQAVGHVRLGQSPSSSIPGMLPPQSTFMTSSTTDSTVTPLSRATDVVIATRFLHSARNDKSGPNGTLPDATKHLLIVSSSGYLTEYILEPRPQQDGSKVSEESPVVVLASERICWPLQRQTTWNTVPFALPLRSPLLAADNLCRRHYDLTRFRLKEKQEVHSNSSSTSDDFPPLDSGRQSVRSEQPRSLEKSNSRTSHPGSALPRTGKRSKSKKSAWNNVDMSCAPESVDIQRNGVTADDEMRFPTVTKNTRNFSDTDLTSLHTSEEWLSQVEMITHEGPARRLWMGPQFHFKRFLSTGNTHVLSSVSSALLSNQQHVVDSYSGSGTFHDNYRGDELYEEELDVRSLNIHSIRSEPVPTPAPRPTGHPENSDSIPGCYTSISIEAGSGNFDRTTRMLEIKSNGSLEERRYSSLGTRPCEDALIERIADAMQDFNVVNAEAKFSLSSSPRRKPVNGSKPDAPDFVLPDSFDFRTCDTPSLHIPSDT